MRKIIEYLVRRYNRTAANPIEVVEPTTYSVTKTSAIDVKAFLDKDPKFLENIVAEKMYDMRHAMIDRLWNDEGAFKSAVEYGDDEIKLQITLNVYNDGEKSDDDELAGDGVRNN